VLNPVSVFLNVQNWGSGKFRMRIKGSITNDFDCGDARGKPYVQRPPLGWWRFGAAYG